jgi:hypothetical protein
MSNIKVGKHNGPVPNDYHGQIVMDHQINSEYQRELTKPIRFVYSEGKVKAFEADQSEPEWSLNIKKSILSLFNVNLTPKKIIKSPKSLNQINKPDLDLTVYPVYEVSQSKLLNQKFKIHSKILTFFCWDNRKESAVSAKQFMKSITFQISRIQIQNKHLFSM